MAVSPRTAVRRAATIVAVLAVVYLLAGIGPASRPFNADDFRHDWAAGKALLRGQDFYDGATLQRIWAERPVPGAVPGTPAYPYLNAPHYTFLAAPFSALPFPPAKAAYAAVSLLCYAAAIVVIGGTVARAWPRRDRILGAAAAAGFAPAWFAFASGQASLIVFAALVGAGAALLARRDTSAGLLLAAAAFKYSMGFLLLPYLAYRRRWKALAVGGAVATLLSLAALARSGLGAVGSFVDALRLAEGAGGINSPFGPASGSDLSLLPLFARIATPRNQALAYLLFGITLTAIVLTVVRVLRRGNGVSWLEMSIVLLVCQLAVYHRAYDAVVVVLAGAVALSNERIRRAPAALALSLASAFVVANAHAPLARGSGRFAWLWDVAVLSHRTWAVLALFGVLCWAVLSPAAGRSRATGPSVPPSGPELSAPGAPRIRTPHRDRSGLASTSHPRRIRRLRRA